MRMLRELFLAGEPLSKAEIARRSGVSLPGVVKALPRLFDTGVAEPVGTGGRQLVAVREEHPLSSMLHVLFRTEALQHQELIAELGRVAGEAHPAVRSAWMDEGGRLAPSVPVSVYVLANSADVPAVQDALRPRLAELSARFGVTLELFVRTLPDLAAMPQGQRERLENATVLHGPNPLAFETQAEPVPAASRTPRTHADREGKSLRRAMWIVRLLDRDPAMPQRARSAIVHRLHTSSPRETADLTEWLHLLESAPIPTLQYVLLRKDERSDRLRQNNPFIMALSPRERSRMVEETAV
ncbi:MAG TPA: hypothetical protein VFJ82_16190 [Longimicrobium sp.]|nr:hypothetical protein [Longimicrobium sp.]